MDLSRHCAIAVMAKVPQPGRSKTRLSPTVPPEAAAAMSAAFLRDTTENIALAAARAPGDVPIHAHVAYAPAGLEALFDGHLAAGTGLVLADGSDAVPAGIAGFGACLFDATRTLFGRGYGAVCVLNSDGPTLPTDHLLRAAVLLSQPGERVVLGPAEDGGYYLLGMKRAHAALFTGIAWSTADVAEQTRARAAAAGLGLVQLPAWFDVDDGPSLLRLLRTLEAGDGGYPAPATRAAIERLGIREHLAAAA